MTTVLTPEEQAKATELGYTNPDPQEAANLKAEGYLSPAVISPDTGKTAIDNIKSDISTVTGTNAAGQKGVWQTNPTTGINEFIPEGTPPATPLSPEDQLLQKELDSGKTPEEIKADEIKARAASSEADMKAILDPLKASLNANKKNQIDIIQSQYSRLIAAQTEANARNNKLQETIGVRFGGRFVPEHTEALYQDSITRGLQKISDLTSQENEAIGKVQSAFDEKSYTIALKEYDTLKTIRDKRDEELAKISEIQTDALKKLQEDKTQAAKDTAITNIFSDPTNPITDPTKILAKLNSLGYKSITMKDIGNTLKTISDNLGMDLSKASNAVEAFGALSKIKGGLSPDILALSTKQEQLLEFTKRYKAASEGTGSLKWQKIGTDKFGDDVYGFVNESTGTIQNANGRSIGSGGVSSGGGSVNSGGSVAGITATSEEYQSFLQGKNPQQTAKFNSLNDQEKTNVMGLIEGDILLSDIAKGGIKGSKAAQVYNAEAKQIDPTYSENVNKQRYAFKIKWNDSNGKAYQTRTGINTALGHLSVLKTLTDGLANNGDFQKANSVKNWIAANINSQKPADPNKPDGPTVSEILGQFSDTVDLLAMEIARAYKGGVPDQNEITRQIDSINSSKPKNVISAIINNKAVLMSGLISSQAEEYKKVMGRYPTDPVLNPEALSALKTAGVDVSKIEAKISHQTNPGATISEPDAQDKIVSYLKSHPENKDPIQNAMNLINPKTKMKYTAAEILQAFPEWAQ